MPKQAATGEWASATLAGNEIWQAIDPCRVTADPAATTSMDGDSGVLLKSGDAITFAIGATVIYRSSGAVGSIWREPTA
jgi:hypothetical protein